MSFWIWNVWKGREKLQKSEYLENKKIFLDEIKNIFDSFWRTILWLINKILIKSWVDENGHSNKTSDCKIKGLKSVGQETFCEFVTINLVYENFYIFDTINEIIRQMKQLSNQLIFIINPETSFASYCLFILSTREKKFKHITQNTSWLNNQLEKFW